MKTAVAAEHAKCGKSNYTLFATKKLPGKQCDDVVSSEVGERAWDLRSRDDGEGAKQREGIDYNERSALSKWSVCEQNGGQLGPRVRLSLSALRWAHYFS